MVSSANSLLLQKVHDKGAFSSTNLNELKKLNSDLCIGDVKLESFAYADDVSLLSSTVTGMQNLVGACYYYSKKGDLILVIKNQSV